MNPTAKSISPRNPSKTSFLTFDMVASSKTQTPFSPVSARIISMQLDRKQHTSHSSGREMYSKISLIKLNMQHCFHVSKRSNSIRITSHESFNQSVRLRRLFLAFRAALFPCKKRTRCMSKNWASSVTRVNSIHGPSAPCLVDPRYHRGLPKVSL